MRDRRHIDRNEGAGLARAQLVDRLGNQFLARPAFAGDQHGEIVAQQAGDHAVDALHRRTAPDQRERAVLYLLLTLARWTIGDRLRHRLRQFVEVEGLGEIFERIAIARTHRRIERVLRGQYDDRHGWGQPAHGVDRCQSVAIFQHHVGEHHVEPVVGQQGIAPRYALAGGNIEAVLAQRLGNHRRDALVVLDQQNTMRHRSP